MAEVSTKSYLVRAIYEWCTDSGYRPFIAVVVDGRTQVPREFVRNGEIVLNISAEATNRLHIGNELLEFEARFSGAARHVSIPIDNLSAIFAEENGRGMAFEVPSHAREADDEGAPDEAHGSASQAKHEAHDGAQDASGPALESVAPAPADEGGARPENQAKKPAEEAPATSAKRAGSGRAPKRARKTTLRDVSSRPDDEREQPVVPAESTPENRRARSRTRKPAIAAVPRDEKPRGEQAGSGRPPPAGPDRPGDDDPGPGAPPRGKPRLTRVK